MAHFAEIDYENKVIHVSVVRNEDILDENGNESEDVGIEFLKSIFGTSTRWIQTSYNGNFRCRYAGNGMVYNVEHDVFVQEQPYPSWILNTETFDWESPIGDAPTLTEEETGKSLSYVWNEETQEWDLITSD